MDEPGRLLAMGSAAGAPRPTVRKHEGITLRIDMHAPGVESGHCGR